MTSIPAFNPAANAISATPANRFSEMSTEDFVRIIFTELSNQDPFQPNDSSALLEQLNSIRSIESDISLVDKLDALVFENQLASASSMIGRFVSGLSDTLAQVSGEVVSVLRNGDEVLLELDSGHRLPVDSISSIDAVQGSAAP